MFEAKHNRSKQVSNFTTADNIVKAQIGTGCNPVVLNSVKREVKTVSDKLEPVITDDGSMSKIEEMKFKSKYNKYHNQIHKVEMQLKQIYSKYYE